MALIFVGMTSRESWGAESEDSGWKVSGEVAVMTTPEGGDLAAGVVLEAVPVVSVTVFLGAMIYYYIIFLSLL